jgi:hypothetical protein
MNSTLLLSQLPAHHYANNIVSPSLQEGEEEESTVMIDGYDDVLLRPSTGKIIDFLPREPAVVVPEKNYFFDHIGRRDSKNVTVDTTTTRRR